MKLIMDKEISNEEYEKIKSKKSKAAASEREYYAKNGEEIRRKQHEYYEANKERLRAEARERYRLNNTHRGKIGRPRKDPVADTTT